MSNASFNISDLPGRYSNTIFLMHQNKGYSFLIEKVDGDVYEFTICIYDDEKRMNRFEYVLHCNKKSLRDLQACITKLLSTK